MVSSVLYGAGLWRLLKATIQIPRELRRSDQHIDGEDTQKINKFIDERSRIKL
jgi:hypothetical protein